MVRSYGKDLVSRTPLPILRQQALSHGVTIPITDRRDVVGTKTFLAINNITFPGFHFVNGKGTTHHRDPLKAIKQRLYEQVSGTGDAGIFLHRLTMVENRDALVAMCVILDSENVSLLDVLNPAIFDISLTKVQHYIRHLDAQNVSRLDLMNPTMVDTRLANIQDRTRIFSNLSLVANHGYPAGNSPHWTLPPQLPKMLLLTNPANIDWAKFTNKIATEIRYMVYDLLIEGRVVKVHIYKGVARTTCPAPVIMHLTSESRRYALERYELLNDFQYYHLELDTLALTNRLSEFNKDGEVGPRIGYIASLVNALPMKVTQNLKKIALGRSSFTIGDMVPHNIGAVNQFASLERFTWIHNEQIIFEPHHVFFAASNNVEDGLVDATEAELIVAFDDKRNHRIGGPETRGLIFDEVDELCFGV